MTDYTLYANKSIYIITGYIPSDEKVIVINVYMLVQPASGGDIYIANISQGSGIGFRLVDNKGYESEADAIIGVNDFLDDITKIGRYTFQEMLEKYNDVQNILKNQNTMTDYAIHSPNDGELLIKFHDELVKKGFFTDAEWNKYNNPNTGLFALCIPHDIDTSIFYSYSGNCYKVHHTITPSNFQTVLNEVLQNFGIDV